METTLVRLAALGPRAGPAQGITAEEFEEIVRLHQRRVYRVLLALVRDPDTADTLTQECFLRAYRNRAGFRREARVETWLLRIAVNLARDHAKNRRQGFWRRLLPAPAEDAGDPIPSPERALLAREELDAVWSAVEKLSPQQRTIFLLRFVEELTLEEIARTTELEVGTVKSHLFRAVGAVRKRIREQGAHG